MGGKHGQKAKQVKELHSILHCLNNYMNNILLTKTISNMVADKLNRVLIVEDNENDLELTMDALSEYNLINYIDTVTDGEQALDYLYKRGNYSSRESQNPIVILLDLKLPKVSGLEVLKDIKQNPELKTVPVVILTSSKEESDIISSYEYGVNAYVVKPVEFHGFIDAVKQLGVFWAMLNEPPA
jgi:CheY-like chemotaxis protein